ncbi:MAG: hypothetical protein AAGK37_16745 [Pseudomonadota bacterium]
MRPMIRSVFVLSIFGVLAAHVSSGALYLLLEGTAAMSLLDSALHSLLIGPFGREVAVYSLIGLGGLLALFVYVTAQASQRHGRGQSYSTW